MIRPLDMPPVTEDGRVDGRGPLGAGWRGREREKEREREREGGGGEGGREEGYEEVLLNFAHAKAIEAILVCFSLLFSKKHYQHATQVGANAYTFNQSGNSHEKEHENYAFKTVSLPTEPLCWLS